MSPTRSVIFKCHQILNAPGNSQEKGHLRWLLSSVAMWVFTPNTEAALRNLNGLFLPPKLSRYFLVISNNLFTKVNSDMPVQISLKRKKIISVSGKGQKQCSLRWGLESETRYGITAWLPSSSQLFLYGVASCCWLHIMAFGSSRTIISRDSPCLDGLAWLQHRTLIDRDCHEDRPLWRE